MDLAEIDPVFFEKSYYLVPDGKAEKPYALLVEAMQRTGKVAIGRFVLRTKKYLATLRARDGVLVPGDDALRRRSGGPVRARGAHRGRVRRRARGSSTWLPSSSNR